MSKYDFSGRWSVGVVLDTPQTRRWTPEQISSEKLIERQRVYAHFSYDDGGRSRQLVAHCPLPGQARAIVEAHNALFDVRDERQKTVHDWCIRSFGAEHASSPAQRGLRLLEEAIEAFQAVDGDPSMAHRLVDFVFSRPKGEIGQELGGIGVTTLALAAAVGRSAEAEEGREVERVLSKSTAHFAARNAEKNAAGFDVTGAAP